MLPFHFWVCELRNPSLGGNSVKASSGINGAETEAQRALKIDDSVQALYVLPSNCPKSLMRSCQLC
jgi:hypothetical protein